MRRLTSVVGLCVIIAACSGQGSSSAIGFVASSPGSLGTGEQRVLLGIRDLTTNEMLASPDRPVSLILRDEIGSPLDEYEGEFIWAIPDSTGLYVFHIDFPGPATYQLDIEAEGLGSLPPVGIIAVADPVQVTVGEPAPRSETRTVHDHPLDDLTSDPDPSVAFYEMTVAEAVSSGPSIIVFATPAWCTSQTCGPMLDQVKAMARDFPLAQYVHVEIYEDIHVTERADLKVVPAVEEWQLPSEPWLYVVDDDGVVTAAFEGALSDSELREAIAAVSG